MHWLQLGSSETENWKQEGNFVKIWSLLGCEGSHLLIICFHLDFLAFFFAQLFIFSINLVCCRSCELLHSSNVRLHIKTMNSSFMMSQMIALDESFVAQITLESFTSVAANVSFEIVALRKAFVAEAGEGKLMRFKGFEDKFWWTYEHW